jgi:hypothetical protein
MTINKVSITEAKKTRRKKKLPYDSISYTTGNIDLNISRFNTAMGSAESMPDNAAENSALTEAKRYVRRYYIRPMNIFCSNKAEIIKALIEIGNKNCSVYTLNNLGDEKDVTKLMNSDIIYYYDDGILYDKNKVKVMDYDLSIKKEENRKYFTNVDKAPEKEFKAEYSDRMTDATELEENFIMDAFAECNYDIISADFTEGRDQIVISLNHNVEDIDAVADDLTFYLAEAGIGTANWTTNGSNVIIFDVVDTDIENPFDLAFEDYNVFGERLTEAKEHICCVCGEPFYGYGNNPEPYKPAEAGQACNGCNLKFVIPARLEPVREE